MLRLYKIARYLAAGNIMGTPSNKEIAAKNSKIMMNQVKDLVCTISTSNLPEAFRNYQTEFLNSDAYRNYLDNLAKCYGVNYSVTNEMPVTVKTAKIEEIPEKQQGRTKAQRILSLIWSFLLNIHLVLWHFFRILGRGFSNRTIKA